MKTGITYVVRMKDGMAVRFGSTLRGTKFQERVPDRDASTFVSEEDARWMAEQVHGMSPAGFTIDVLTTDKHG